MTRAVCAREGKPGAEAGMGVGLGEQTIPTERTLGKLSYNWSGSIPPMDKGLPRLPTRAVVITDHSDHQEFIDIKCVVVVDQVPNVHTFSHT